MSRTFGAMRRIIAATAMMAVALPAAASSDLTPAELPDSPGVAAGQAQQTATPTSQVPSQGTNQPSGQSQPSTAGTAAAPGVTTTGNAAARPAGAAIAPAKQRRIRTILISTGIILGAAAAIGTVAGLTAASGSKPPGAK